MGNICVIDIGTSSMRGILINTEGKKEHVKQIESPPTFFDTNRVEQNPLIWRDGLIDILRSMANFSEEKSLPIDALAITSQRSSIIPVDTCGTPIHNAIMWQDKRCGEICEDLGEYSVQIYNKTGTRLSPIFAGPKISWLRKHHPDIYNKSHKIIVIPDYILFLLTGIFASDFTYGSRTCIMDIHSLDWDDDLLKLFQIDKKKLCELHAQGTIIGTTTKDIQGLTGLRNGTPVISAGGDQQCAALGAGVIENGSTQITTGTGSFILMSSDSIILDDQQRVSCNVSAIPGKYVLDASILTTSAIYNWFHKNFYYQNDFTPLLENSINLDAEGSPVGANGIIMLPYFQGRGSPDWNHKASGMFYNLSLSNSRKDFARAILEGIAAEISENFEIMKGYFPNVNLINIGGGLTKFSIFNQILADFLEQDIYLPNHDELTSLGAWVSAATTLGIYSTHQTAIHSAYHHIGRVTYSPNAEHVNIYNDIKQKREKLYKSLYGNSF